MEDAVQVSVSVLTDDELETWFDFLATVFAEKGTPREYFVRHVTNDPWFDVSAILVAKHEGKICSTARVFQRKLFLDGCIVPFGGIGEVSTDPDLRQKGLASKVLDFITEYVIEKRYPLTLLHSSRPLIQGIYQRRGWFSVPIGYGVYNVNVSQLVTELKSCLCVKMNLREIDHCRALMDLYGKVAVGINGLLVRDNEEYWTKWIFHECIKRQCVCFALEDTNAKEGNGFVVSAYLIGQLTTEGGIEVLEYFCSQMHFYRHVTPVQAFMVVLHETILALKGDQCSDDVVTLTCPLPFLPQDWLNESCVRFNRIDVDTGCMYRVMDGRQEQVSTSLQTCIDDASYKTHAFSKLDSF
jgi:GNAT superfamily N-acetyltransferase